MLEHVLVPKHEILSPEEALEFLGEFGITVNEMPQILVSDPALKDITVVVLTTSQQETDIVSSYELGCKSFITKPVGMDQFLEVIQTLQRYWFQIVVLPPSKISG